jgi:hypothetical protein
MYTDVVSVLSKPDIETDPVGFHAPALNKLREYIEAIAQWESFSDGIGELNAWATEQRGGIIGMVDSLFEGEFPPAELAPEYIPGLKRCPFCKVGVIQEFGSNDMICQHCGFPFCYRCGKGFMTYLRCAKHARNCSLAKEA